MSLIIEAPSPAAAKKSCSTPSGAIKLPSNRIRTRAVRRKRLQPKAAVLVCVIDPDESVRDSVSHLLLSKKYSVDVFASAQAFLRRNAYDGPCCLLVDAQLPGENGLTLLQTLYRERRTEQLVFLSAHHNNRACAQAIKAGAVDFLTKPFRNAELLSAVETALARSGNLWQSRKAEEKAQALLSQLTPRERAVLSFVITGKINREIASTLCASQKTIKNHRGSLTQKSSIKSVAGLVHFCLCLGSRPACSFESR